MRGEDYQLVPFTMSGVGFIILVAYIWPTGVANDRIYARDRSRVAEWGGQVAGGVVDDGGQVGAAHAASDLPSESQPPG